MDTKLIDYNDPEKQYFYLYFCHKTNMIFRDVAQLSEGSHAICNNRGSGFESSDRQILIEHLFIIIWTNKDENKQKVPRNGSFKKPLLSYFDLKCSSLLC